MKETKTKTRKNFLSTDLTDFENFMLSNNYNPYHVGLLKRGPNILFELFGSMASFEFLQSKDFREKFEDVLAERYKPGTIRRYSYGIQHYHDYLVHAEILIKKANPIWRKTYIRKEFLFYHKNRTPYYHDIENVYSDHINIEKEYCADEKRKRLASYRKFVSYLIQNEIPMFEEVSGLHIVEFGRLDKTLKTDWNYLKYFLKFAYRQGYVQENFTSAFLSRVNTIKHKKRFLEDEKIDVIVKSIDRETITEKRDFSMINLMARLGLRPSETTRIKLKHIDWVNSRILICGKGNREDWLPLTQDVVEPIIEYLKVSADLRQKPEYLFLGERPPFKPLRTHRHLSKVLSEAYQETEIRPPCGSVRLNVFRHSIATSIVNRKGQNFFSAQSLLRHSSPKMTMNYARFHSKRQPLFELDWPEKMS